LLYHYCFGSRQSCQKKEYRALFFAKGQQLTTNDRNQGWLPERDIIVCVNEAINPA